MPIHGHERSIYLTYLQQVPMFSACTTEELERIAELAAPRTAHAGDVLVGEGETGEEFFVLCTGRATVTRGGQPVASLGEGDFFGEIALFADTPRNATVTASAPSTLVVLSRGGFRKLLGDAPAVRDALLRGMALRLHELDGKC